jgi:hypothetical protein
MESAGLLAASLEGASLQAQGQTATPGNFIAILEGAVLSATGTADALVPITGTFAATLDDLSLAARDQQQAPVFVGIPRKRKPLPILGFVAASLEGASLEARGSASLPGSFASSLDGAALTARGAAAWPDDEADALALILALAA